jgi:cupin fold WbuC family metalloprotein
MTITKKYSGDTLKELVATAQGSDRLRTNLNIHESPDADVQRLFLAFEPGTYIRPHHHPQAHKWELFIVLEGELDLLLFNDLGEIVERITLSATATRVVEIPPNTWHSYISKKSGTLALEIKQGAYLPSPEDDFLSMSPAGNTKEAAAYLQWMKNE